MSVNVSKHEQNKKMKTLIEAKENCVEMYSANKC